MSNENKYSLLGLKISISTLDNLIFAILDVFFNVYASALDVSSPVFETTIWDVFPSPAVFALLFTLCISPVCVSIEMTSVPCD